MSLLPFASRCFREWNVNTTLKSTSNSRIEHPRDVGGAKDWLTKWSERIFKKISKLLPSTPSLSTPTPCIWTRNSVLMRRAASDSLSLRDETNESISSMKMILKCLIKKWVEFQNLYLGLFSRAIWNKLFTNFSDSPSHLDTRSELEMDKKVELFASVATALARYDLSVPGGP